MRGQVKVSPMIKVVFVAIAFLAVPLQAHELDKLFESYWEGNKQLNPDVALSEGDLRFLERFGNSLTDEYRTAAIKLIDESLGALARIDPKSLPEQDRISYDMFKYLREQDARFYKSRLFEMVRTVPISQMGGAHVAFAELASGESIFPFRNAQDYEKNLQRADGFDRWVDDAIARMREGVSRGWTAPRVLMEKVLPQIEAQLSGTVEGSMFYRPIANMPATIPAAQRKQLAERYRTVISNTIRPAYRRLYEYLKGEYLPASRSTAGISAVPQGKELYTFLIRLHTNTELAPQAIHQTGLREVERIMHALGNVQRKVGFKGALQQFFEANRANPALYYRTRAEVLEDFNAVRKKIDARLPLLFNVKPQVDYVIKAVPRFMEESQSGAHYNSPSADGTRPGILWINTYRPQERERFVVTTTSLHEASPGHHFQSTVSQEVRGLPSFRRFDESTAFGEGWALYAESLGYEMGLYDDPWQEYGHLNDEAIRANRLVIDTGLHALNWTREQSIRWMMEHSTMSESASTAEVERYMAIPGQALAYKIGQMEISALRAEAKQQLGARFDVKAFHDQVLLGGSMPLPVLRAHVERWIRAGAASP
jgi:uncharacterized protein (DUF885 family)